MNGGSLLFLVAMFVLLWALLIRPQKAKQQRQRQMLEEIEPGDEVLTVGGIYGIVQEVDEEDDEDLVVEIADGIHVRIARRAVATVVKPEDEDEGAEAEADEDADGDELEPAAEAGAEGEHEHEVEEGLVTVPDEEASLERTQRRLFRRR